MGKDDVDIDFRSALYVETMVMCSKLPDGSSPAIVVPPPSNNNDERGWLIKNITDSDADPQNFLFSLMERE